MLASVWASAHGPTQSPPHATRAIIGRDQSRLNNRESTDDEVFIDSSPQKAKSSETRGNCEVVLSP